MTFITRTTAVALFLVVSASFPLYAHAKTFAELVNNDIVPFGNTVIGLLYAIAFLLFLVGVARMFFSTSEESRTDGRVFAVWGIVGLAVLFAVWGIVRVLLGVLGSFNT